MSSQPTPCQPPEHSPIRDLLPGADFYDAWRIAAGEPQLSALEQCFKAFATTPRWVDACMRLRNRAVALVGLKDLGSFTALDRSVAPADLRAGDRIGIFTLISNHFDEVLFGDRDKHLDVTLSVHRAPNTATGAVIVTVTTVVQVHNWIGRVYMLPVRPMHKLIAPTVLRKMGATDSR